jgi:ankyrin repeat protein
VKVNVDEKDEEGRTAFECAIRTEHWDIAELLISKGADKKLADGVIYNAIYWNKRVINQHKKDLETHRLYNNNLAMKLYEDQIDSAEKTIAKLEEIKRSISK